MSKLDAELPKGADHATGSSVASRLEIMTRRRALGIVRQCLISAGLLGCTTVVVNAQGSIRVVQPQEYKKEARATPPDGASWFLTAINDLAVDSAGRIYVLERSDQTIRVFSPSGKHLKALGRRGDGPGEFRNARALVVRSGSLWVLDYGNSRVTAFGLAGTTVRTFSLNPAVRGVASVAGVTARGFLVYVNNQGAAEATSQALGGQAPALFVSTDSRGQVLDTVATSWERRQTLRFSVIPADIKTTRSAGQVNRAQPFVQQAHWVMSGDGVALVTLGPVSFRGLGSEELRLSYLSLTGDTLKSKRVDLPRFPLTDRDVNKLVDSLAMPFLIKGNIRVQGDRRMIRDSLVRTSYWPSTSSMLMGEDGSLWLKSPRPSGEGGDTYWVLSKEGETEARVTLPKGFRLVRASRAEAWGWSTDEDGSPVVERYRLSKPIEAAASRR
ncbi:6-bladed beta-propeller [Gemmatimonas sp. UBA7669]|uniref:6-bladed beta-propeller n=1 Tax=Gemmatimonas sp. UBA7669 TaxID=1946568 RepID=UPI0025C3FFD7|nr:6-bladed beta-propeller [Gemmatimonas sp. UBA7669]